MNNNAYFVYQDTNKDERQSDGVEFCIIPEFHDGQIYFYCQEYMMFWRSISDVENFDKCCKFNVKNEIKPATLTEICNENLIEYVDLVKEYVIENNKLLHMNYIYF